MSSGISHILAGLHASKWRMVFSGHVDEGEPTPRAMSSAIARPRVVRCTDCTVVTVRDLLYCIVHQPAANTGRSFVVQPALQDEPRHPRGLWGQVSQKNGRKPTQTLPAKQTSSTLLHQSCHMETALVADVAPHLGLPVRWQSHRHPLRQAKVAPFPGALLGSKMVAGPGSVEQTLPNCFYCQNRN